MRCSLELRLGEYFLPDYPIPEGMTVDQFFTLESEKGLQERLEVLYDTSAADFPEVQKRYAERLEV